MLKLHLSRLLGERKMSQAELARLTAIRPNTISELYHGSTERVSLEHIDRICEALDCPFTDLMELIPSSIRKTGADLIIEPHANRKTQD